MQQVVFTIEDQRLEEAMTDMIRQEGVNLQDFIRQAIQAFIRQKSVEANKLDPFRHSTPIYYPDMENGASALPFEWVHNSAHFGKELRAKAWNRGHHG